MRSFLQLSTVINHNDLLLLGKSCLQLSIVRVIQSCYSSFLVNSLKTSLGRYFHFTLLILAFFTMFVCRRYFFSLCIAMLSNILQNQAKLEFIKIYLFLFIDFQFFQKYIYILRNYLVFFVFIFFLLSFIFIFWQL